MSAAIIGIITGLGIISTAWLLKQLDKSLYYGLVLCAIGFLYVGYTWSHTSELLLNSIQAIFFLFLAYYGMKMKQGMVIVATGFFLHGIWDLAYSFLFSPNLLPPHYDIFCLTADFTIGAYLLLSRNKAAKLNKIKFPHTSI